MRKRSYGTHEIARICQVTPPTVRRWMKEEDLPFFTTMGGHRKVWDSDLAVLLKANNLPVPKELAGRAWRVLIVDDEVSVCQVINRTLLKLYPAMELYEARDGFDAGQKIIRLEPDLIILDIQLPGVDGLRICKALREDKQLKGIKILAISGHNIEKSKKQSLSAGADDFLGKPFSLDAFKEKIAQWVGKNGHTQTPA